MHIALVPLAPVWDAVGRGGGGSVGPEGMGDVSRSFRRRRVKEVVWMRRGDDGGYWYFGPLFYPTALGACSGMWCIELYMLLMQC